MPYLSFINDQDLEKEVSLILSTAAVALKKANTKFGKNVIDPFSVMFEMAGFNIDEVATWEISEKTRQSQKTLSNAFGTFHQNILGHIDGWKNLGIGHSADLDCADRKIIAEVKNKYNTVTGAKQSDVYDHLEKLVMPIVSKYKGYTAYYVETIPRPKRSKSQKYNVAFTPSDKQTKTAKPANELIRKIDGQSFYELVTGIPDALEQLYDILPEVISNLSGRTFKPDELVRMKTYFKRAFV
jgi:hypothetical protein